MDGGYSGYGGKRSYDSEGNGESHMRKRRNASNSDHSASSGETEYRILCPAAKIGSVIGKGGDIIKAIRQETRSRVKVEALVPGVNERVIYICSSKERYRDGCREEMLCPAQEALFRVYERITDTADGSDEEDDDPPRSVTVRLLVQSSQIGCLLGKGGHIIERMRKEIGGQIRVLPRDQVPVWAMPNDELVQMSGDPTVVRKALYAVSTRLHENPPRERTEQSYAPFAGSLDSAGTRYPQPGPFLLPSAAEASIISLGHSVPSLGTGSINGAWSLSSGLSVLPPIGSLNRSRTKNGPSEEFSIRVLCPNDKIGSIIGKDGSIIKKLREDTGAKIKVGDSIPDCDERIIEFFSTEYMDGVFSCVLDAALQVQRRLADLHADKDRKVITFTTRLLVPSSQIGCLIGKGGQIISEMRRITRAKIQIPSKDDLPPCAGENDELVQISGDLHVGQFALIEVLQRLRSNLFKEHDIGGGNGGEFAPSGSSLLSGYGGRHEPIGSARTSSHNTPPSDSIHSSFGRSHRDSQQRRR